MKLRDIILEETSEKFDNFAETRGERTGKIAASAKEKGGPSMLTYHHFNVKLPYYKKAAEGKFDLEAAKKEFEVTYKKISPSMGMVEFQREMGRLEVLGELIIKHGQTLFRYSD